MKRLNVILLAASLILGLSACASENNRGSSISSESAAIEQQSSGELLESSIPDRQAESSSDKNLETSGGEEMEALTSEEPKVLVAYFSGTGNTRKLAEYAADGLGADLYEIIPQEPYSSDDLNYNNDNSRANIEMNDDSARPAISGGVDEMEEYDIIFLGYPIWWGQAPRILDTFIESYDFSGKTIVPFCTSGSSGVGSSATALKELCSDGSVWLEGSRLDRNTSRNPMVEWINQLELPVNAK